MADRSTYLPSLGAEVARAAGLDMSLVYHADLVTPTFGNALLRVEMAITQECMEAAVAASAARTAFGPAMPKSVPAAARITVELLPDGQVHIASTCMGRFDSSYAALPDARAAGEVARLVDELRERLAKG